jgi:hypothetical protein
MFRIGQRVRFKDDVEGVVTFVGVDDRVPDRGQLEKLSVDAVEVQVGLLQYRLVPAILADLWMERVKEEEHA